MTDPETIEVMAVIHMWLDHWKDILSEPDGPAHARGSSTACTICCNAYCA